MTASTYNRRNSSATPYVIPVKHQNHINQHQHQQHHQPHIHHPSHHHSNNQHGINNTQHTSQLSTSVPTLSREFVVRRISEGESGRLKEELRCEACGKGYKHISSLAKHLWEHTPEWNVTKKLLISKHQQVQLLEAASILVGMNDNQSTSAGGTRRNSYIDGSIPPTFKSAFNGGISETYDPKHKNKVYKRSHSVSQYPPSSAHSYHGSGSPAGIGGYLDHPRREHGIKGRSNSIAGNGQDGVDYDEDHLKSPASSYHNTAVHFQDSPQVLSPRQGQEVDRIEYAQEHEDDEVGIIGKMET
ncbi:uncharacterized protein CANTADRAFT_316879 [Suhomyces tanzawaensis NRRL Y-17324]|uniref:C2H2-type domain-containing protein n=1 Tax=Suhomyces tanzawaensis NRRL Y-17324 TaxID=984487 RepID=A0A1E4SDP7_9ASCO|nr:uncharacterized protein CANTADRAFT_316879 [Suhomyces tanzawaensis NRRL Y-17324]ODV77641.1 hypothetical protein CANTADRAFT_316879 [Suhomyces tanzawaensis NRRL Y-17324]